MAERNDMTAALVTAYTSPQLAAINEYCGGGGAGTGYDIFKRGGPLFRGRSSRQRKVGGERPCLTISHYPPNSTA